jgi:thiol:disulfide interchange protein
MKPRIVVVVVVALAFALVAAKLGLHMKKQSQLEALVGRKIYDEKADGKALVAAALSKATAEHKRVLVQLGGNWCTWCLALDKLEEENADVHAFIDAHYVSLKLDVGTNEDLDQQWGKAGGVSPAASRDGVPVLVFLNADGTVVAIEPTVPLESLGGRLLSHDPDKVLDVLRRHASS